MNKVEREMRRLARAHGLELEQGSKHFRFVDREGRQVAVAPRSNDFAGFRSQRNLLAVLKRHSRSG